MFEGNWTLHPAPHPRSARPSDGVPAYAVGPNGTVDEATAERPLADHLFADGFIDVDPQRWATTRDGVPLVLARNIAHEVWIERALLVDPPYQATADVIDAVKERLDRRLEQSFWLEQEERCKGLEEIELREEVFGLRSGQTVILPAGTYRVIGTVQATTIPSGPELSKGAPFLVVVQLARTKIYLSPFDVLGADDSETVEAQELSLPKQLTASEVLAALEACEPFWKLIPEPDRFDAKDLRLHYVDAFQMGAVYVLRRPPEQGETFDPDRLSAEDRMAFLEGQRNPGLRIGDDLYVQHGELGVGVEHHEAVHWFSAPAVRWLLGFDANEGMTEYFTRIGLADLMRQEVVVRDKAQYGAQRRGVKALLTLVPESTLAAAYFGGDVASLFAACEARLGARFSVQAYADRLPSSSAAAARLVLLAVAGVEDAQKHMAELEVDLSALVTPTPPPAPVADAELVDLEADLDDLLAQLQGATEGFADDLTDSDDEGQRDT